MKLLIDTNVLIWWMEDQPMLGPSARALLADPRNSVIGSIVSIWEITMKWRAGKFSRPGSDFAQFLSDECIDLIDVEEAHLLALETLDLHHKDPFDHLIIAQAKVEGARIITSDREMTLYGVPCIPATR